MAAAVRGCVGSCLSNSVQSWLSSAKAFVTDPNNHLARYFQSAEGRDKAFKLADPIFDMIGEIAKASGASEGTLEGIGKGRALAKTGRDAMAFFNIFASVIPGMIQCFITVWNLVKDFTSDEKEVALKSEDEKTLSPGEYTMTDEGELETVSKDESVKYRPYLKHNEVAKGKIEKFLAIGANLGNGIACAAYIAGFGLCKPISSIEKHGGIKFGETTHKIGQAFPTVMIFNHVGALLGGGCNQGYLWVAYSRAMDDLEEGGDAGQLYKEYSKKVASNTVAILEKSFECMHDITYLIGKAVPAWFRIPLGLMIGFFGCYKQWLKTA